MNGNEERKKRRERSAMAGKAVTIGFASIIIILAVIVLGALLQTTDEKEVKVRYDGQSYYGQQSGQSHSSGGYSGWNAWDSNSGVNYSASKDDMLGFADGYASGAVPSYDMGTAESVTMPEDPYEAGSPTQGQDADTKIAYYYTYDAETTEFDRTWSEIQEFLDGCGGYVESYRIDKNEFDGYGNTGKHAVRRGYYALRVPADEAGAFRDGLAGRDGVHMEREDVRMQDFTDAYADTKLQAQSYQKEYDRLEELIPYAENVTELISIQDRLSSLNYQIQYAEKRMEGIDTEVRYSEVELTLYEVEYYKAQIRSFRFRMGERIADAFDDFLYSIPEFFFMMVYLSVAGLVIIGLGTLAARIWISIRNKRQKDQVIHIVHGAPDGDGKA